MRGKEGVKRMEGRRRRKEERYIVITCKTYGGSHIRIPGQSTAVRG